MSAGAVDVRFNGVDVTIPGDATIGSSPTAGLHLPVRWVSSLHAHLSPRHGGIFILADRGELRVNGESCDSARVIAGQTWWFAPGAEVEVVAVRPGTRVDLPTAPPEFLSWKVTPGRVVVTATSQRGSVEVQGTRVELLDNPARVVTALLLAPERAMTLESMYEEIWLGQSANAGIRRRLDELKGRVNSQLEGLALGDLVVLKGGVLRLVWRSSDRQE